MKLSNRYFIILAFLLSVQSCRQESPKTPEVDLSETKVTLERPNFSSDSSYYYIEQQLAFGPRVPGTDAHLACKEWLEKKLTDFDLKVIVQSAQVEAFDGTMLPMYNIIASVNPENKRRIVLAAHWDSRPFADQDIERREEAIMGANDGGSGVGVLLEVGRQLANSNISVGVDIVLFDVEDYGQPDWERSFKPNTYCLGSQYWSTNPHVKGYRAQYGILLDMVGAEDAVFTMEGHSMQYAPDFMRKVWDTAIQLGHSKYFRYERTAPIIDDHYYVNKTTDIKMIDIIQHDRSTPSNFGKYWHTHEDNIDIISKSTLQAVGETVIAVVQKYDQQVLFE